MSMNCRSILCGVAALFAVPGSWSEEQSVSRVLDIEDISPIVQIFHPENQDENVVHFPHVAYAKDGMSVIFSLPYGLKHEGRGGAFMWSGNAARIDSIDLGRAATPSPNSQYVAYYDIAGNLVVTARTADVDGSSPSRLVLENADPSGTFAQRAIASGESIAWASDNRRLVFLTTGDLSAAVAVPSGGETEASKPSVYLFDTTTGALDKVYESTGELAEIAWVPNSDKVLLLESSGARREDELESYDMSLFDVQLLDTITSEVVRIAESVSVLGGFVRMSPSPEGTKVAYYSEPFPIPPSFLGFEPSITVLETGGIESITDRSFLPPYPGEAMKWSPDGASLYYRCKAKALFSFLCVTDTASKRTTYIDLGQTEDILALDINFDRAELVRMSRDVYDVVRLKTSRLDGASETTILEFPRLSLNNVDLGEARQIEWTSFDGLTLAGLLILPVKYDSEKKYPLIVDVHGGPAGGVRLAGSIGNATPLEWQLWAGRGYAVFVADYRLSAAYGAREEYLRRPVNMSRNEVNAADILAGVDHLVAEGIADPDKLAIIGHSYGAVFTNWIVTQTDRFKAAISKEGAADSRRSKALCLKRGRGCLWALRATPDDIDAVLAADSAQLRAANVKTPLLIFSGQYGFGNPEVDTSEAFANAINAAGGTAVRVHYEDDYHNFRKPENIQRTFVESVHWIDKYMGKMLSDEVP